MHRVRQGQSSATPTLGSHPAPAPIARHVVLSPSEGDEHEQFLLACAETARGHNVRGWARTSDDNAIEAWFEGDPFDVDDVMRWCQRGTDSVPGHQVSARQAAPQLWIGFDVSS